MTTYTDQQKACAPFDFLAHLQRQREWSERTFGPGDRAKGVVDHIRKELREIEADPTDFAEWADVVILGLDGFWRAGATPQQIIDTIVAKQTKNEGRTWPDWRTMPADKAIEHDRSKDACAQCGGKGTVEIRDPEEAWDVNCGMCRGSGLATPAPDAKGAQGEPVGEIVLFGGDCKEVSWRQGIMPDAGAKLYAAPLPRASDAPADLYQRRMKPTWQGGQWSEWEECSAESVADIRKTPLLHDWVYEVREFVLRDTPATAAHAGAKCPLGWYVTSSDPEEDPRMTDDHSVVRKLERRGWTAQEVVLAAPTPVADSGASDDWREPLAKWLRGEAGRHMASVCAIKGATPTSHALQLRLWADQVLAAAKPVSVDAPTAAVDDGAIVANPNERVSMTYQQYREMQQGAVAMPERKAVTDVTAYLVEGINGYNESSPSVWLKRANAETAAAGLFRASITPLPSRTAVIEECAQAVEPKEKRPCDCEHCDCGNSGDAWAVAVWDEAMANANRIRALATTASDSATPRETGEANA